MKSVKEQITSPYDEAWKQTCHHASGAVFNKVTDTVWHDIYRSVVVQISGRVRNTVMDELR